MHTSTCKNCGGFIKSKYKSKAKKYCSKNCIHEYRRNHSKAERVELFCRSCGGEFSLLKSRKEARERQGSKVEFCSVQCAGKAMRKKEKYRRPAQCPSCGGWFSSLHYRKYCSDDCMRAKRNVDEKGQSYWLENGYKVIHLGKGVGIKEHRKVMQEHIGRELDSKEVVHHINGNRLDNRIENLQVMSWGEHSRLHRQEEIKSGKRLFNRG